MLALTDRGLYCSAGDFFVDPVRGVDRAVITHAHSDHARSGSRSYLTAQAGVGVLHRRLGPKASIQGVPYGVETILNGVRVSFHPAGHVLGSAQVRLEHRGEVWVVSGDYKTEPDPTCTPFEPVRCHTFITECTFGLPVYQWAKSTSVLQQIQDWWFENQRRGQLSVLLGYALGKAPRLLAEASPEQGPILVHPSVRTFLPAYEAEGVRFPSFQPATLANVRATGAQGLIIAPPQFAHSAEIAEWGPVQYGMASGWMLLGKRRRRASSAAPTGFALSDHADWPGLLQAIEATRAHRILATHGYTGPLVRWLREQGLQAEELGGSRPDTGVDDSLEDEELPPTR